MEKGKNCGTRLPQFFHGIATLNTHFNHIVEHVSFFSSASGGTGEDLGDSTDNFEDFSRDPWTPKSKFNPRPEDNPVLEEFLTAIDGGGGGGRGYF